MLIKITYGVGDYALAPEYDIDEVLAILSTAAENGSFVSFKVGASGKNTVHLLVGNGVPITVWSPSA